MQACVVRNMRALTPLSAHSLTGARPTHPLASFHFACPPACLPPCPSCLSAVPFGLIPSPPLQPAAHIPLTRTLPLSPLTQGPICSSHPCSFRGPSFLFSYLHRFLFLPQPPSLAATLTLSAAGCTFGSGGCADRWGSEWLEVLLSQNKPFAFACINTSFANILCACP